MVAKELLIQTINVKYERYWEMYQAHQRVQWREAHKKTHKVFHWGHLPESYIRSALLDEGWHYKLIDDGSVHGPFKSWADTVDDAMKREGE